MGKDYKRQREPCQKVNMLNAMVPKHENKPKAVFKEVVLEVRLLDS